MMNNGEHNMNDLISMDLEEVMAIYAEYEADGGWETYEMLDELQLEQQAMGDRE